MAIFADALGIDVTPRWFAHDWGVGGPATNLNPTTYFGAGATTTTGPTRFRFHQIVSYNGLVYDPSTGSAAGVPTMNMTFYAYLDLAFRGQRPDFISQDVSTITIKP
jgi:hypothetical protein